MVEISLLRKKYRCICPLCSSSKHIQFMTNYTVFFTGGNGLINQLGNYKDL
jgi:hypothetical protein